MCLRCDGGSGVVGERKRREKHSRVYDNNKPILTKDLMTIFLFAREPFLGYVKETKRNGFYSA